MSHTLAVLLTGTITGTVSFVIGSVLWFAPWAMKITNKAQDLPIGKNLPIKIFILWINVFRSYDFYIN
ncbi:MAG: hypothetical protein JEY91_02545 [Spirochaetaceae bacterium]|nr:hypothetical protein [Spirochaetaceae bacterium]